MRYRTVIIPTTETLWVRKIVLVVGSIAMGTCYICQSFGNDQVRAITKVERESIELAAHAYNSDHNTMEI